MFPTVSAAVEQNIGPFFNSFNLYGASNQLASRLVPKSAINPSTPASIAAVATAIWEGLQIINKPLAQDVQGLFGTVPAFILGDLPRGDADAVNATGANPGLYAGAWNVVYAA